MDKEGNIYELVPQIPGESDASYTRFILYLKKGFNTLKEYADYLQTQNDIPPVTYKTIEANSYKDKWTERRKKYFKVRLKEKEEHELKLINAMEELGIKGMKEAKRRYNPHKSSSKQGYCYIVTNLGLIKEGLVKIGKTVNIKKRLSGLNCASPHDYEIVMVLSTEDKDQLEKELHEECTNFNREFFRMDKEKLCSLHNKYKNNCIEYNPEVMDLEEIPQFDVSFEERLIHLEEQVNQLNMKINSGEING